MVYINVTRHRYRGWSSMVTCETMIIGTFRSRSGSIAARVFAVPCPGRAQYIRVTLNTDPNASRPFIEPQMVSLRSGSSGSFRYHFHCWRGHDNMRSCADPISSRYGVKVAQQPQEECQHAPPKCMQSLIDMPQHPTRHQ